MSSFALTIANMSTTDIDIASMSHEEFDKFMIEFTKTQPYIGNSTDTWRSLPDWEIGLKIGVAAFVMLVSLVGNGLVLFVLLKKRSLRNVTNMFIVNLAIADILVTVSTTWVHLIDDLAIPWILGAVMCKYSPMIEVVVFVSSILTMTAISMERFFGIVTPFIFCSYKREKMLLTVVAIWLIAFSVAIPAAVYTDLKTRVWLDYTEIWCSSVWPSDIPGANVPDYPRRLYYLVMCLIHYVIPMIIMTASYSAIIVRLRAKESKITELNNNLQKNKHSSRKKVIVMLIILLTVFTICWLPLQTLNLYYQYQLHKTYSSDGKGMWVHEVTFAVRLLADANSAFNPVIFICFSQKIRRAICGLVFKKTPVWIRSPHVLSRANSLRSSTRRTWV